MKHEIHNKYDKFDYDKAKAGTFFGMIREGSFLQGKIIEERGPNNNYRLLVEFDNDWKGDYTLEGSFTNSKPHEYDLVMIPSRKETIQFGKHAHHTDYDTFNLTKVVNGKPYGKIEDGKMIKAINRMSLIANQQGFSQVIEFENGQICKYDVDGKAYPKNAYSSADLVMFPDEKIEYRNEYITYSDEWRGDKDLCKRYISSSSPYLGVTKRTLKNRQYFYEFIPKDKD